MIRQKAFSSRYSLGKILSQLLRKFSVTRTRKLHTPSFYAIIKDKNKVKNGEWNGKKRDEIAENLTWDLSTVFENDAMGTRT